MVVFLHVNPSEISFESPLCLNELAVFGAEDGFETYCCLEEFLCFTV